MLAQMVRGIKRGQHPLYHIHSKKKIRRKTRNVNSLIKATRQFKVGPQILNCCALGKELFSSIVESQDTSRSLLGKQRHFHSHLNCSLPQCPSQSLNSFHYQIPPPDTCINYLRKLHKSNEANNYPRKFWVRKDDETNEKHGDLVNSKYGCRTSNLTSQLERSS